jgi:hypothetical protein
MAARVALVDLVLGPMDGPRRLPGDVAIRVRAAIETLEAACENVGALDQSPPLQPARPVDAGELAAVRDCIARRSAELDARRARRGGES